MITGKDVAAAIRKSDSERHEAQQAWFDDDKLDDFYIDGRVNLNRVAELLNELTELRNEEIER
mgnify:CR=1 FL=1